MKTVVVLAAGNGSRYGGPKQFARFGPLNLTLMQYNLCHAISAGYKKAIIIIQEKYKHLLSPIVEQLTRYLDIVVCIQSLSNLPAKCELPAGQSKPLGTAHALWCARDHIQDGMTIINADDYYGEEAFVLASKVENSQPALIAYQLKHTLSNHGGVNRGLCEVTQESNLTAIDEIIDIVSEQGRITGQRVKDGTHLQLDENALISMNFWVLPPDIISLIESELLRKVTVSAPNALEIFLPDVVSQYIQFHNQSVKVLTSLDLWFGVTYEADATNVNQCLSTLTQRGEFSLFHE